MLVPVKFTREHKNGLVFSTLTLNRIPLLFVGHEATRDLKPDQYFEIHWRMLGPTKSSLVIKMQVDQVARTIVDSQIEAADGGQKSAFNFIKL